MEGEKAIGQIAKLTLILAGVGAVLMVPLGADAFAGFVLGALLIYAHYILLVGFITKLVKREKGPSSLLTFLIFLLSLLLIVAATIFLAKKAKNMLIYYFLGLMTLAVSANIVGLKFLLRKGKNGGKTLDS